MTRFFINTVLLEKNRWEPGRIPSLFVSRWIDDFKSDGFDGIELWENHALKVSEEEVKQLHNSTLPIEIFNSYVRFEDQFEEERARTAELVRQLGITKVKFNLGSVPSMKDSYIDNLLDWQRKLPKGCQLLCECHPGTIMEEPKLVEEIFDEIEHGFGVIVHPFHPHTDLESWFNHLGSKIVHAHVSLFENSTFHLLENRDEFVKDRIHLLEEMNFKGTYSIEFTAGTAIKEETPSLLYENALKDLKFLSVCLNDKNF